jgi:hypothetical protein
MTTYATDGLYDWPFLRRLRWLAGLSLIVGLAPALLFVYVYLRREIVPLFAGHAAEDGLVWPTFTLSLAAVGIFVIVAFVIGNWPKPAIAFDVDDHGLTFHYANGRTWGLPWNSPRFRLKLVKVPDGRYEAPHAQVLSWLHPPNRVPIEAADELTRVARQKGLAVRERTVPGGTPPGGYIWIRSPRA